MSDLDLLTYCGADGARWAEKFCETAKKLGQDIDEGWMIGWFCNAIEQAIAVRSTPRIETLERELAEANDEMLAYGRLWRRAAIEEAAKVAESEHEREYQHGRKFTGHLNPVEIAAAIRALAKEPTT